MCGQVRLLLAETLATALFLTLASLAPAAPAVSWGATFTLATLLAGQGSVLNPALTLALVAGRQTRLATLPVRVVAQLAGAVLSAATLLHASPPLTSANLNLTSSLSTILTPPPSTPELYTPILHFTLASLLLSLLLCASRGSSIYQGLSLGLVIHVFGEEVGLGLNPAREVGSRLVVAWSSSSWQVFLESRAWLWVPVTWSTAGALIGSLLHWLLIEIPHQCEGQQAAKSIAKEEAVPCVVTMAEKPPAPPPPPPAHWPTAAFLPRDETRASQVARQLERYQALDLGTKEDHRVTIPVPGQEERE